MFIRRSLWLRNVVNGKNVYDGAIDPSDHSRTNSVDFKYRIHLVYG